LFMLISKYGFTDALEPGRVVLDPSRVAAQIVTGVGFLVGLPRSVTAVSALRVRYPDGHGRLRDVLKQATNLGFAIDDVSTEPVGYRPASRSGAAPKQPKVQVTLHVHGRNSVNDLAASLSEIDGVDAILASDVNEVDE
jgi:uncharacterized membrane protein YhiD involved in acid resistance